jgi:membrane fusion protein (multidrug efflux system)
MFTYQRVNPYNVYTLRSFLLMLVMLNAGNLPSYAAAAPADKPKHVIVAPVVLKEISDRVEALGTARANESVDITSNVAEKIKEIHFEDGQRVKAGEILVVLNNAEEQANLKQAQAVRGERKLALDRLLQLEERQLAAEDVIDRTRLELEQAEASITAIKARISDRVIRAPFDGVVGLRDISVGALVETGDLIATLDDISQIKLDFSVPAMFLSELKPGLTIRARASALGNKAYSGEVKSIDSRVDSVTRSVQVRAILPNPEGSIIPGILMQIDLLRNTRQAIVIPEAALLPLADSQYVMVRVNKEGKDTVEKRAVQIGIRMPGQIEILSGLSVEEYVVTHGNSKVRSGDSLDVLAIDDGSVDIATIIKGQKNKGQ